MKLLQHQGSTCLDRRQRLARDFTKSTLVHRWHGYTDVTYHAVHCLWGCLWGCLTQLEQKTCSFPTFRPGRTSNSHKCHSSFNSRAFTSPQMLSAGHVDMQGRKLHCTELPSVAELQEVYDSLGEADRHALFTFTSRELYAEALKQTKEHISDVNGVASPCSICSTLQLLYYAWEDRCILPPLASALPCICPAVQLHSSASAHQICPPVHPRSHVSALLQICPLLHLAVGASGSHMQTCAQQCLLASPHMSALN